VSDESKAAEERELALAVASVMRLVPSSIVSREPRAPDLLCQTTDRGLIAVEIVGPIDSSLARQVATGDTRGLWFAETTVDDVRVKLRKTYETPHPMELLICPRLRPLPGIGLETRLISLFEAAREDTRPGTSFQRLWLFAAPSPQDPMLVYPPLPDVSG
jgi:hypothetical protein